MKKITILALLLTWGTATWAEENENQKTEEHKQVEESKRTPWNKYLHGYQYQARVAYNIGGTAPIGLPATIRTLHSYTLQPNFSLGIDAYHPLSAKWGFVGGLHFENKGMKIDAGVKNYYMRIVRGGEELKGIFTGNVVTKVDMSLITVPLKATYDICDNLRFKLGPYVSYVTSKKFEGWAYDGYLRRQEEGHPKGDPTGQKVKLGHDEGERGDYDFSDDMRNWQVGVDFGIDWRLNNRWGLCADLSWGLNGIFKKDFETIEQTMYPIYGSVGITYQLK